MSCCNFKDNNALEKGDDAKILEDMGYSQELYRGITGWFMNFAFTFTAVSIISSYSISFGNGLNMGGPVVMVWGWVVGSIFTIGVGLCLSEICSTYPSAGSVYHWSGMLANREWAPFFSYVSGWFNLLGNAAGDAAFASGCATIISSTLLYYDPIPLSTGYQVLISICALALWTLLNVLRVDQQGWVNNIAAIYQILSTLFIIIFLLVGSKTRSTPEFVFTTFYNGVGIENYTYVVLVGILTTLFAFSGYEAGGHLAEETQNARKSVPVGMALCCVVASIVGLIYIIGLLFSIPDGDIEMIIHGSNDSFNSNETFALKNLFTASVGKEYGPMLMILVGINVFFAGISSMTVTARIAFAMARDGALPGSKALSTINKWTRSPIRVVFLIFVFDSILLTLPLANKKAFESILSLTTIGFQISYAIPIWLRITQSRDVFPQGEFNLGRYSLVLGWISALWLTLTSLIFFLPFEFPVDETNMNYTVAVVGSIGLVASIFWITSARKWFTGPRRGVNDFIKIEVDTDVNLDDEKSSLIDKNHKILAY